MLLYPAKGYQRVASIPVHHVVDAMKRGEKSLRLNGLDEPTLTVSIASNRLLTYTKGITCVHCGKEAHFFAVERQGKQGNFHLNLYHIGPNGKELMMTSDHIVAKANCGGNELANRQPMCLTCNGTKSDYATMEEAVAAKQALVEHRQSAEDAMDQIEKNAKTVAYATSQLLIDGTSSHWKRIIGRARQEIVRLATYLDTQYKTSVDIYHLLDPVVQTAGLGDNVLTNN